MAGKEYAQLVTISSNTYDAAKIEAHLRSAGQPVRMATVAADNKLIENLRVLEPDIIFCDPRAELDPAAYIRRCVQAAPATPVLVLADALTPESIARGLEHRARDTVCLRLLDHLRLVFMRELSVRHGLKSLKEARSELAQLEQRLNVLMNRAQDAVAYVQDGLVLAGNATFAQCLGLSNVDAMVGQPLMDYISKADHDRVKKALSRISKHKSAEPTMDCTGETVDGKPLKMHLELRPAEFDGESCIEILAQIEQPESAIAPPLPELQIAPSTPAVALPAIAVYSRSQLVEALKALPTTHALLFCWVDEGGPLNNRVGFMATEALLKEVRDFAHAQLPGSRLFDLGHGEFVLAFISTVTELEAQAAKLVKAVEAKLFTAASGASASLHLSVTAAFLENPAATETLLTEMRQGVSDLLKGGGNKFKLVGAMAKLQEAPEVQWRARIETAIRQNHFQLRSQLIASLEGDEHPHAMLYPVWQDKDRTIEAAEFVPWAEKAGIGGAVDRWTLAQVIHSAAAQSGQRIVFVPVGEASLKSGATLVQWLVPQLATVRGIDLVLCFQEKRLIYGVNHAAEIMGSAGKKPVVRLGVMGFEGNASSLKLLKNVPLAFAGLTDAATKSLLGGRGASESLNECLAVARERGTKVIAAPTRDAHGMALLWQAGINFVLTNESAT